MKPASGDVEGDAWANRRRFEIRTTLAWGVGSVWVARDLIAPRLFLAWHFGW